jgi:formylmethanofuran dehydrogenase subunit E
LRELESRRAPDEELVALVETDACGVDAVQVVTGCTLGKGNLLYRDYGKSVYTFGRRDLGKAVRVVVQGGAWSLDEEFQRLREKVRSQAATPEDQERFRAKQIEIAAKILEAPEDQILKIQEISFDFPEKARIFASVTCAVCGEQVMEPRARVRDGKFACVPCSETYSRGWCDCGNPD